MMYEGIFHKCGLNDCYCLDEDTLVIRLHTNHQVDKAVIVYDDPYKNGCGIDGSWDGISEDMEHRVELEHEYIYSIKIKPQFKRIQYYFKIQSGAQTFYVMENGVLTEQKFSNKKLIKHLFKFGWMNKADICSVPDWAKKTIWYQIFPERFNKGAGENRHELTAFDSKKKVGYESYYGGNLKGILDRLEYIRDLGITGIYLNPVFLSQSNHKYSVDDYTLVDPDFGTNELLSELVAKAHDLGLKVMLDAVFNHSGPNFFAWQDVVKNGRNSKYFDWYFINTDDFIKPKSTKDGRYYSFAFVSEMPKLNTSNPEVVRYCTDICKRWIKEFDIDGIRFDVGNEISHDFIKILHKELRALKSDIFLLGEIWMDSTDYLLGDEYDSVMNYPWLQSVRNYFADKSCVSKDFMYSINYCNSLYKEQINDVMFNLLDSHDIGRIVNAAQNEDEVIQMFTLLMTLPGTPSVYYGTEVMLEGDHDPVNRKPMPWHLIDKGYYDEKISLFKSLIKIRRNFPELYRNNIRFSDTNDRTIAFERELTGGALKVVINANDYDISLKCKESVVFSYLFENDVLRKGGILITKCGEIVNG